jgi:hypothetical protein
MAKPDAGSVSAKPKHAEPGVNSSSDSTAAHLERAVRLFQMIGVAVFAISFVGSLKYIAGTTVTSKSWAKRRPARRSNHVPSFLAFSLLIRDLRHRG